ncbi:MAG: hypothetical protein IJE43_08440 [Alphaproteobacteria bacterium]|nr:hypothetical protein [Alphaproteobacteria bacterium]
MEHFILKEFEENSDYDTTGLALIILFQTGMRLSELASIKPSNIHGNYLTVERAETSYNTINPDGTKSKVIYEIKEFPKTADGNRDIPLSEKAKKC